MAEYGEGGFFRRWARRAVFIAAALGITYGGAEVVDEATKPPRGTFATHSNEILGIDTSTYRITPVLEGIRKSLAIRKSADIQNEGTDNTISGIVSINGQPWDGVSPIDISNSPVTENKLPDGITEAAPWLMVELEVKSLLGDITETVGYINHSSATSGYIERINQGEFAEANIQNGQITAHLDSGETVPSSQIGTASPVPPGP